MDSKEVEFSPQELDVFTTRARSRPASAADRDAGLIENRPKPSSRSVSEKKLFGDSNPDLLVSQESSTTLGTSIGKVPSHSLSNTNEMSDLLSSKEIVLSEITTKSPCPIGPTPPKTPTIKSYSSSGSSGLLGKGTSLSSSIGYVSPSEAQDPSRFTADNAATPAWLLEIRQVWNTGKDGVSDSSELSKENQLIESEGFETDLVTADEAEEKDFEIEGPTKLKTPSPPVITPYASTNSVTSIASDSPSATPKGSDLWKKIGSYFGGPASEEVVALKKYIKKLKSALSEHEHQVLALHAQIKKIEGKSDENLEQWSRWAADNLIGIARTFYQNKLLWLKSQVEIEIFYLNKLNKMISAAEKVIAGDLSGASEIYDDKKTLIQPYQIRLSPKYEGLRKSCKEMEEVLIKLLEDFKNAKKGTSKLLTKAERRESLRHILEQAANDSISTEKFGIYYHRSEKSVQSSFNRFILDERYHEGKTLRRWRTQTLPRLLKEHPTKGPKVIRQFCRNFSEFLLKEYDIPANENVVGESLVSPGETVQSLNVVELFVDRLIYPRIQDILLTFRSNLETEMDAVLVEKFKWLRKLSQSEMGIAEEIQSVHDPFETSFKQVKSDFDLERFPYGLAIRVLSKIEGTEAASVPSDILYYCAKTMTTIEAQAKDYCGNPEFSLSADSLLPIIVWCVVHSKITRLNEHLAHINRFANESALTYGFSAYCVATISGKSL
jgi:hypothetical protein